MCKCGFVAAPLHAKSLPPPLTIPSPRRRFKVCASRDFIFIAVEIYSTAGIFRICLRFWAGVRGRFCFALTCEREQALRGNL